MQLHWTIKTKIKIAISKLEMALQCLYSI